MEDSQISIHEILLSMHEGTLVISFEDIRRLLDTISSSKYVEELNLPPEVLCL